MSYQYNPLNPGNPNAQQRFAQPSMAFAQPSMGMAMQPGMGMQPGFAPPGPAHDLESIMNNLSRRAERHRRATNRRTFFKTVPQTISELPYKGKLVFFLRNMVELHESQGWKFIKPDAKEAAKRRKAVDSEEQKTSTILFDPVASCQINLDSETSYLRRKSRKRKASKAFSFEQLENDNHGKLNFRVLKAKVKTEADKFQLNHDFDVNKIISFALQDFMKTLLEKLYVSSQIRRNLPLEDDVLKDLIVKSTRPQKFLQEVRERDEVEHRNRQRIEEIKMLKSEENALEDARLQNQQDRLKLDRLKKDMHQARAVIHADIEARATRALGMESTDLNFGPVRKRQKVEQKEAMPQSTPQLVDCMAFLETDRRFRKSDFLYKHYINLGRTRKIDLKDVFNR